MVLKEKLGKIIKIKRFIRKMEKKIRVVKRFLKKYKLNKNKLKKYKLRKYKLKDTDVDLGYPDGLYQNVFKVCFIHPFCIFAGAYYNSPIATILATMLSMTSFNYWRYPLVKSIRRIIDMIVAFTAIPYHIYLSLSTTNRLLCTGLLLLGSIMYPISLIFNKWQYHHIGCICHCLLHVFVSMGAIFTYRDYYIRKKNASSTLNI